MACALYCGGIRILKMHPNTREGLCCFQDHHNSYAIFSVCQLAYTLHNLLSCWSISNGSTFLKSDDANYNKDLNYNLAVEQNVTKHWIEKDT